MIIYVNVITQYFASPFLSWLCKWAGTSDWLVMLQQEYALKVTVVSTHQAPRPGYRKVS